jgi:hypothetical protein
MPVKVRIEIRGTAPLITHNIRLANPLDPIAKAMKVISGKRKKTEDDLLQLARLEFEGGLYLDPDVGPFLPGENVEKCIVEGARVTKQGKQVERGLFVSDNVIPLIYKGPRTAEELWVDENFRNMAAVRVGQARVMRMRPMFRTWALDVDAEIDPGLLAVESLQQIVDDSGAMVGLGDHRPRYGRFMAKVATL